MKEHLNIVSLTVPYPVNFGGVFDLFHKLKALHSKGIKIHLHCFEYGRGQQPALNDFCETVTYYPRVSYSKTFFSGLPHIVASRINEDLFNNLLQNNYPILMEGLHCSFLLKDERFNNRKRLVRMHNIESDYYADLGKNSVKMLQKLYCRKESALLKQYESSLPNDTVWLCVSKKDAKDFSERYGYKNCDYLPLFLPEWSSAYQQESGNYCLYHGDLSISSNNKMALLLAELFAATEIPFVIAGHQPSKKLLQQTKGVKNIEVIASPSNDEMHNLITKAKVNIVPSLSATGIKLKLINALYNGKHCIANAETVAGTEFEDICAVTGLTNIPAVARTLMKTEFTKEAFEKRVTMLRGLFNNGKNADRLIQYICS